MSRAKRVCRCGSKTCARTGSVTCERRVSRRLHELAREAIKWEAEAKCERLKQLMLQNDLTQRYIIIDGCQKRLTQLMGGAEAESFIRALVPAPFVRTLGPLEPIFAGMLKAEAQLNALPLAERVQLLAEKKDDDARH